jgi:hypothetical protein
MKDTAPTPRTSAAAAAAAAAGGAGSGWSAADCLTAAGSHTTVAAESEAVLGLSSHTRDTHTKYEARQGVGPQLFQSSAVAAEQPAAAPTRDSVPQCVPVTAKVPPPGWSFYYDSITKHAGARPEAAAGADMYSSMANAEGV